MNQLPAEGLADTVVTNLVDAAGLVIKAHVLAELAITNLYKEYFL